MFDPIILRQLGQIRHQEMLAEAAAHRQRPLSPMPQIRVQYRLRLALSSSLISLGEHLKRRTAHSGLG